MRVGGIIFFRMNSKRLPGKPLLKLSSGITILETIIDRVKKIKQLDHFCVATSNETSDDLIFEKALNIGIDVYRGSLDDVMSRSIGASTFYGYTDFLRICGDRPFLDPFLYDEIILAHKANKNDLTTNIFPRTVPPGLTGEIINVQALKEIAEKISNKKDKEHLTNYFYSKKHKYIIQNINQSRVSIPVQYNLTLDNKKDLQKVIWIDENLNPKDRFNIEKIMSLNIKWVKNK